MAKHDIPYVNLPAQGRDQLDDLKRIFEEVVLRGTFVGTGEEIMQMLERLNAEGRTIIMVTHETSVARRARRQIVMKDGLVAGDGMLITDEGK